MEMKRIEAETLEEAYGQAAKELNCSVTEINYEIVQHPTSGVMGMFKKMAIIIAVKKIIEPSKDENLKIEEAQVEEVKEDVLEEKEVTQEPLKEEVKVEEIVLKEDALVDNFFNDESSSDENSSSKESKTIKEENKTSLADATSFEDDRDSPENKALSLEIEKKMQTLLKAGCFEIDTVEVDVFDGIAHIFIDGDDAALLIGKEGYRYNALSYMLFNWINSKYDLYIKLEIAAFIQTQEEMIDSYLKPIAEYIKEHGKGKTKPLDGILVQIALEKLRDMFPNKYIAIKTGKDAKKFIIINDFNTRKK